VTIAGGLLAMNGLVVANNVRGLRRVRTCADE
jgi:hypothetical protein